MCLITSFPSTLGQTGGSNGPKKTNDSVTRSACNKDPRSSHGFTHFAFLSADHPDESEFLFFESADCGDSHRFSERSIVSVICEDLRKSVYNPSGRDGLGCPISLRRSRFAFNASVSRFREGAL